MSTTSSGEVAKSTLSSELQQLAEHLAEWQYSTAGEGLDPWSEIPDADRRVYRDAAQLTLQTIIAAGYAISRQAPDDDSVTMDVEPMEQSEEGLIDCRQQAERFLRTGEPLLAYNTVQQGLETWPDDLRLRQLQSLALARSGAVKRANEVLRELRDEGYADSETYGLLARTHKDLGLSTPDADARLEDLKAAFSLYEEAYVRASRRGQVADAYYTGINAATMAVLRGDEACAKEIAGHVRELCKDELAREDNESATYWIRATIAEAALILRDRKEAEAQYRAAAKIAGSRYGDLGSTRRQARLLLAQMDEDDAWLEKVLSVPPVLVYAGHMIDQPDREDPRFPASLESAVEKQIRSKLERINPVAAYGSAACGADILCLEAVRDLGGEIHITLPFPPDEFKDFCVDFVPKGTWGERFENLLEAADSVIVASDHRAEGSVSTFEYANLIMTGMCWLRSEVLETSLVGLAVWDGGPNGGVGGTTSVVDLWRSRGIRKELISITELRRSQLGETMDSPDGTLSKTKPITASTRFPHEIKAMLFADAVGYSKLTENQIPNFIECFLGAVAELNDRSAHPPIHMETAGDGLYFVFTDTADAGHYALELSELVATIDWQEHGLPSTFDMRIGLHCGPVFCTQDPITKLPLYTGPHTSRTARIEPITPPGQVYASSAFAAVAAATGVDGLKFSYIGRTQLAKKYGSLALYHVQRP